MKSPSDFAEAPEFDRSHRVYIVEDDASVRTSLARLLEAEGFRVHTLASANEYRQIDPHPGPACLVLDINLPGGPNGLDLQQSVIGSAHDRPIVFITGCGDIPSSVRAMKHGAVDFLTKPFSDHVLLAAVRQALERDVALRKERKTRAEVQARLSSLTQREHQVLEGVIRGRLNKQIAADLGITEKTVKVHRGRVMAKMGIQSVAELVHLCEMLDLLSND